MAAVKTLNAASSIRQRKGTIWATATIDVVWLAHLNIVETGAARKISGVRTLLLLAFFNANTNRTTSLFKAPHVAGTVAVIDALIALLATFPTLAGAKVATHAFVTWRIKGAWYAVVSVWNTSLENA